MFVSKLTADKRQKKRREEKGEYHLARGTREHRTRQSVAEGLSQSPAMDEKKTKQRKENEYEKESFIFERRKPRSNSEAFAQQAGLRSGSLGGQRGSAIEL